jgi:hypothetical protein
MNKNTTILLGAIAVLAIGAGAYVSMSSPSSSDKSFSTQSVRWWTRSLVGSSTKPVSQSTPPIQAVPQPECDPSAITSTIKELSTKDINPKTPELEWWSTKTFEQCVDLNWCYWYEVKNTNRLINMIHWNYIGLTVNNESWSHNISFDNPNIIQSANNDDKVYTTFNKSGCYTFTITKMVINHEWKELCLENTLEVFNFPAWEKILQNTNRYWWKWPISESLGSRLTCFNRDNPNLAEQAPTSDDGM